MSLHDALGLFVFGGFALVALRRVLPAALWEAVFLGSLLAGLVIAAAYAPEIDGPSVVDVAGEP